MLPMAQTLLKFDRDRLLAHGEHLWSVGGEADRVLEMG